MTKLKQQGNRATGQQGSLSQNAGDINWENRTLFISDNLPVLRGMNSRTVDLIYLDPPFNSKKQYKALDGTAAEGQMFDDVWKWTDLDDRWLSEIDNHNEALSAVIRAARLAQDEGTAAYLTMMGVRLLELHRVLKPTGSIYLHCDPTASHYLKASMDAVFGKDNFQNDLVWCYQPNGRGPKQGFHRKYDNLLLYSAPGATFHRPYGEMSAGSVAKYTKIDEDGRRYKDFKGRRSYLDEAKGRPVPSYWTDIPFLSTGKEKTGWTTQKPVTLLQRVIKASSNPGDLVLDPFAGCATCCEAAEIEGRQWVGIEACEEATEIIQDRLDAADLGSLGRSRPRAIIRRSAPLRTDADAPPPEKPTPKRTTRSYKTIENLRHLYWKQGGDCNGCGGNYHYKDFHHDHIHPRSKDGGDEIGNLQLLCGHCNSTKGNRAMESLWERLYEQQLPISPAGWEYLKQRGCKDWRIA